MKSQKMLQKHLKNKSHIKITTKHNGDFYGYILSTSDIWIIVHRSYDFHLDGYVFLAYKAIKSLEYGKNEKMYQSLFAAQWIEKKVSWKLKIDIKSYQTLFVSLWKSLLLLEGKEEYMQAFAQIKSFDKTTVDVKEFNNFWKREKGSPLIKNTAIYSIEWGSEYLWVYEKFMKI